MNLLSKIRRIINPPYSGKDLLVIPGVLVLLISIPLTGSLSLQRQSVTSQAATETTFFATGSEDTTIRMSANNCPPSSGINYQLGDNWEVIEVGQFGLPASNNADRAFLSFDTSSLPDNSIIDSAYLSLLISGNRSDNIFPFNINVIRTTWEPPISSTDWNSPETSIDGSLSVSSNTNPAVGSTVSVPLDTAGINRTGRTEYKLKTNKEPNCSIPSGWHQILEFNSSETVGGYKPRLVVNYHLPSPPPPPPPLPPSKEICGDGKDNDGDKLVDEGCPSTPGVKAGNLESLELETAAPYLVGELKVQTEVGGVSKEITVEGSSSKGYNLDLKGANLALNKEYNLVLTSEKALVKKVKFSPTASSTKVTLGVLILGDLNQDNTIDSTDQLKLIDSIASQTLQGDLNADMVTNSFDWVIILFNFGKKGD